ncbi:hypothetical protein DV706_12215 [Natronorubrum bangense]|uniref:Uncharacterized protein n=3 Tax=Natronorubrum bangense TaxID=61858 RepID=L9WTB2_9EURY|nr:hypothetical protein C494_00692 [Natronorubrum bangense JCM 10635]QCC55167.1 hypothetical protein DV706_12215 [Natronorubrum bangense]
MLSTRAHRVRRQRLRQSQKHGGPFIIQERESIAMRSSRTGSRIAAAGVVVANLVSLVGVVFFGWTLHSLLVIYWLESGVLGMAYVAKIRRAEGTDDPDELPAWEISSVGDTAPRTLESFVGKPNRAIARYFGTYFGAFWLFHGVFVLYGLPSEFPDMATASPSAVVVAAVPLAIYHVLSYRLNYLGAREFERNGPVTLMVDPLERIVVLHVTIVLGSIPLEWFGAPTGAVAVMVLVKTSFDLEAHRREHERARQRTATASTAN